MPFQLTILGTSSALPTSNRYPTAQVLNVLGRFFLIDCGEGTQTQMRKFKIGFSKIDHIFIIFGGNGQPIFIRSFRTKIGCNIHLRVILPVKRKEMPSPIYTEKPYCLITVPELYVLKCNGYKYKRNGWFKKSCFNLF